MSTAATGKGFALAKLENCPKCHMALCQCPGAGGWRDISSAPKRGKILLAWPENGHIKATVRIGEWGGMAFPSFWHARPSHWMPLPSPPEKAQ